MKRETLIKNLKTNVMQITFDKICGEERVMHCTLHETVIPETSVDTKKINNEVLPVWDIDIGAWRSFRLDSVKDVKVIKDIL
jgi:hypothetical protein